MAGHELHQAPFRSVPADGCRYQAHALPHQFVYGLVQAVESQLFQEPDFCIPGRTDEVVKNRFSEHLHQVSEAVGSIRVCPLRTVIQSASG